MRLNVKKGRQMSAQYQTGIKETDSLLQKMLLAVLEWPPKQNPQLVSLRKHNTLFPYGLAKRNKTMGASAVKTSSRKYLKVYELIPEKVFLMRQLETIVFHKLGIFEVNIQD